MSADRQIRDLLERMADEPFIAPLDAEPLVRRAHRRMARTVAVTAVLVAIVGAGAVGGLSLIRTSGDTPADHRTAAPIPPLMDNGPFTLFGFTNGVMQANIDGTVAPALVECPGKDACSETDGAAWSQDGTRLAYAVECGGACASAGNPYHGLRVLDVRTGEDRLLVPSDDIGQVDWSPDGTEIAFTTRPDGAIRIVDAIVGSTPRALSNVDGVDSLSWSPDGTEIAYSSVGQMWIQPLDGSDPVSLGAGAAPHWSHDGERIAYTLGDCEVWTMAPDGSARTHLGRIGPPCRVDDLYAPIWSPDDTQVAVLTGPNIELIDVATEQHRAIPLAEHANVFGIAWRPAARDVPPTTTDEQALAPVLRPRETLRQGRHGTLLAVSSAGRQRVLATCAVGCGQPTLSPDGRWLAYEVIGCITSPTCDPTSGLWVTDALGVKRQLIQRCDSHGCGWLSWSWLPEHATIVASSGDLAAHIQTFDLASGRTATIATVPGSVDAFALSPDGTQVAYATGNPEAISVLDLAAREASVLSVSVGSVHSIEWAPDGASLVFDDVLAGRSRVVVTDLSDGTSTVVAEAPDSEGPSDPAWSPDGSRIAYVTTPMRAGGRRRFSFDAWVVDRDGSNRELLYASACCIGSWDGPRWSPTGSQVAFSDDTPEDAGVWIIANVADPGGVVDRVPYSRVADWR
jgi:Tol biopolymer transport system component